MAWNPPHCPWVDEWIRIIWRIATVEHHLGFKKMEICYHSNMNETTAPRVMQE